MKRIVSVSIGSSKRDHKTTVELMGQALEISRVGTDGDMAAAVRKIKELDGRVDAIGLGGIDLYFVFGERKYLVRDAAKLARAAKKTPVFDGSGLKETLERHVIRNLYVERNMLGPGVKVLHASVADRFGMAEAIHQTGAQLIMGDFIFALGLPIPLRSMDVARAVALTLLPIFSQVPFRLLYPTGKKQEERAKGANWRDQYYQWADVVSGDYHFIKKYFPPRLDGKTVITNTVTKEDVEELRTRGLKTLITTTPDFGGRSFGTNVLEGALYTLTGKTPRDVRPKDYLEVIEKLDLKPRIVELQET